jgi:hypothetical protein
MFSPEHDTCGWLSCLPDAAQLKGMMPSCQVGANPAVLNPNPLI